MRGHRENLDHGGRSSTRGGRKLTGLPGCDTPSPQVACVCHLHQQHPQMRMPWQVIVGDREADQEGLVML